MKKWQAICKTKRIMYSCDTMKQLAVSWRYSMLLMSSYDFFGDRATCRKQIAITFRHMLGKVK
jgi:hypothetical protein